MNKIGNAIKNFISPLPRPHDELNKFWALPLHSLSGRQLKLIITMVLEEAEKSRKLGLFLRPQDLELEIQFWLTIVNDLGVQAIHENGYEKTFQIVNTIRLKTFDDIGRYYFDLISNSKPKISSSNNAFECHMEAVQSRILNCIFNNEMNPY